MELGPYSLQIFVSVILILGAAFVALICDFLKGNNEQLRELTLELKIRREEEQMRSMMLLPQAMAQPVQAMASGGFAAVTAGLQPSAIAAPAHRVALPENQERKMRRSPSADAIAAMERGQQLASAPGSTAAERIAARMTRVSGREAENPPSTVSPSATAAPVGPPLPTRAAEAKMVEPATKTPLALPIPAGFQDGFVLTNLVKRRQPVSGLVVSIGVNASPEADGFVPESVTEVIRGLLGPSDFAAQTSTDEFLLIMPEEHGASAQRRLSQIAQQLWDFQLRSLGNYSILFSWGGVEVERETIDEAIASASERMQETKRGRKILTMEPRHLKRAV